MKIINRAFRNEKGTMRRSDMMYEFTIEYYYELYHTGKLNLQKTRTAIVKGKNVDEAIGKVKQIDNNAIRTKEITYKEI